jgi:hypothetical protein
MSVHTLRGFAFFRKPFLKLTDTLHCFLTSTAKQVDKLWLIPVVVGAAVLYQSNAQLNRPIIRSDGEGYYLYLRLYFIHHRLDFAALPMHQAPATYGFRVSPRTGRLAAAYPIGTALCMAPFFLIGHITALLGGWPADGWSNPYQWSILLAGLCWLSVGLFASWCLLAKWFGPRKATVAILIVTLGTNLLHYAIAEPSMSHIYAFGVTAILLWLAELFWDRPTMLSALAMGSACALLFSIRNYDIVLAATALYPALWRSNRSIVKRYWAPLTAGLIMALPQLLVSTYYLGMPWETGYWGVHIDWANPHPTAALFSVGRGWWFWNPVAGLGVVGLIATLFLGGKRRWLAGTALVTIVFVTYVLSCWVDPTFGSGFANRMYVDLLPLVAIGIAAIYDMFPKPFYYMIAVNLYLMLAYWNGYIDGAGTTWRSFVRVLRMPIHSALGIEPPQDSETPTGLAAQVTVTKATRQGDMVVIDATARNIGSALWLAGPGKGRVFLAVRTFQRSDCEGVATREWRFPIASNLAAGQSESMTANIPVSTIGIESSYFCVEMMAANVAWFRDFGPSGRAVSVMMDR